MDVLTEVDPDRIGALRERDEFFWVDLVSPSDEELHRLGEALGLHPVALEDTREFGQRPKLDGYGEHVLLVFYTARRTGDPGWPAQPLEVHVYISGSYMATVRRDQCTVLDDLHETLLPEGTEAEDRLVYSVLDGLTDAFYPVIDALEEQIDGLEGDVLGHARQEHLSQIYRLKQDVHGLQRVLAAQRDQFQTSVDQILGLAGLSRGTGAYLRDIGDHLTQVAGELHRQNEDLMALTSTYFNANADRLNAVVTRLTVVSIFFVTWTLVTGFFGQNFGWLVDHINSRGAFLTYGIGGIVVPTVILATLVWRKRDEWF